MNEKFHTLTEQLHHPNHNVRAEAALGLGKLGDPSALPMLLDALIAETDLNVREDITWSLVRMGSEAVPSLIDLLNHADPTIRHDAAHVLSKIGDKRAANALVKVLADTDAKVVLKVAHALGEISVVETIPALIDQLTHAHSTVKETVVTALENFGEAALPSLIEALHHPQQQVREYAADILGFIGSKDAVPALIEALSDSAWQVRFAVVNSLGSIGGIAAKTALRQHTDSHAQVQTLVRRMSQ